MRRGARIVAGAGLALLLSTGAAMGADEGRDIKVDADCWWQGESTSMSQSEPLTVALYATNPENGEKTPAVNELRWSEAGDRLETDLKPVSFPPGRSTAVVTVTPAEGKSLANDDELTWAIGKSSNPKEHRFTVAKLRAAGRCTEAPLPTLGSSGAAVVITFLVPVLVGAALIAFWARRRRPAS